MDETGFLDVADDLSTGSREADWRSATSRAYYAAFHKARRLLQHSGFVVPRDDQAHAYLWLRLSNSRHPDVVNAGSVLNDLRRARNRADYDVDFPVDQAESIDHVHIAAKIIQLLYATILPRKRRSAIRSSTPSRFTSATCYAKSPGVRDLPARHGGANRL